MTTTRAIVAAIVGVVLAAGLGAAGYRAIANTTDGQVVGGGAPEVSFPATPTATLAVVADNGDLASLAVVVSRPGEDDDGDRGGTVVPVPISADSSGGFGTERTPLNETVALFGADSLADEVPVLLGVGIDETIVVNEEELAALLAPVGPITVDVPTPVVDATGRQIVGAGRQTMTPGLAAQVLSAVDAAETGANRYPIDVAVWAAIAEAVGDGLAATSSLPTDSLGTSPTGAGDQLALVGAVIAGPISVQPLRSTPLVSLERNARGVDAALLDPVEVLVIFGHVAPSKVAAPKPGYNFRIVTRFSADQLADGVTNLDVAYTATEALLAAEANVISLDTSDGEASSVTVIEVSDESLLAAAQALSELFGPVEVRQAETRIAGVDVVATLGLEYLSRLNTPAVPAGTNVESTS